MWCDENAFNESKPMRAGSERQIDRAKLKGIPPEVREGDPHNDQLGGG